MEKQLSVSSTTAFLQCPRRFFYSHEMRWRPEVDAQALRFGKAWHSFLEFATQSIMGEDGSEGSYGSRVDAFLTANGRALEEMGEDALAMLLAMIRGYESTFYSVGLVRQAEKPFLFRLPGTRWAIKGYVDAVDWDGQPIEYKTTSSEIGPDSFYWLRLKANLQAVTYALALEADRVTYVVARKPSLRRKSIPLTDENGLKIVTDIYTGERALKKDGTPRQTAGDGLRMESRAETQEEFIERLVAELYSGDYFVKMVTEVSAEDKWTALQAFLSTARQLDQLRKLQKKASRPDLPWTRNCTEFNCRNCPYQGICLDINYNPLNGVPSGFSHQPSK